LTKILINSAAIRKKDLVISDGDLNVVEGSKITVIDVVTGNAALIYDENDEDLLLSNPFTSDDTGQFAFFVNPGVYKISAETQNETELLTGEVVIDASKSLAVNPIELYGGGADKTGDANSAALISACAKSNGAPIYIGLTGDKYLFDSTEIACTAANIQFRDGVTVETAKSSYGVLWLFNAKMLTIKGAATIDCLDHNAVGIRLFNDGVRGGHNIFDGFTVTNCKQYTAEFTGQANGVTVWGGFEESRFTNVKAINISSDGPATRANGAIARGLVVRYWQDSLLISKNNFFNGCHVENLSPASEADGIFVQENPYFYAQDTYLDVRSCTFVDCLKRSVKSQNSHSYISGNLTIRKKPSDLTDDPGSFGTDYDLQYANATVIGNQCIYYDSDYVPRSAFTLSAHQTLEYNGEVSVVDQPSMSGNFANNIVKMIGSGTPKQDFTGRGFRFMTIQNRVNPAGGRVDFTTINITENECDVPCQMFAWCFLLDSVVDKQIESLNIRNNYARSISDSIVITSDAGGGQSDRTQITANIENFNTKTQDVILAHKQDTGNDHNTINYTHKVNDYVLGSYDSFVNGAALNTESPSIYLVVPKNTQFTVECDFSRRSNTTTQVKSRVVLTAHSSSLGGVLGVARQNEIFDRQAGQWQLDTDASNSFALSSEFTVVKLYKEPGVTSDSYGNFAGDYSVRLSCANYCLATKKILSSGSAATQYNLDYYKETASSFTAIAGARHSIVGFNTQSSNTPLNPLDGDDYTIIDTRGQFNQYNHTVNAQAGDTVEGGATYVIETDNIEQRFIYDAATTNWFAVKSQKPSTYTPPAPTLVYALNNSGSSVSPDGVISGADLDPVQVGNWINASGVVLANGLGTIWSKQ